MNTNYNYKEAYTGIAADEGWHHQLEQEIVEVCDGVWAFIGCGSSIFSVIKSENGYILIDTGDNPTRARGALDFIAQHAPGKLQGVILTHSHPDHRASGFVFTENSVDDLRIYGHYNFGAEQKAGLGLEPVLGKRTVMQFGMNIPDDIFVANFMVPRFDNDETGPLLEPNEMVPEDGMDITIDGVHLQLFTLPSETPDHVQVWLPEQKVLLCGDSAYGSFPNLYPLRGGPYRDVEVWAQSLRTLAELKAEAVVCGHILALRGADVVDEFLSSYAEALEYVYQATIAGMNEGKTADELAAEIRLPEHLRNKPYLAEYYGNVAWSVRSIFAYKVGWFDGNPAQIAPLSPDEEALRMAQLVGGAKNLVAQAQDALDTGDERWAARLAQWTIACKSSDLDEADVAQAHEVLADAYERMAARVLPITAKNYLQTAALEERASLSG